MINKLIKAFSEIDWRTSTSMVNTVGFIGYALDEYNFSYDTRLKENEVNSLRYSAILLAIAGLHYSILDVNRPTVESEIFIRYSDWIFTTPLLLLVLTSYYNLPNTLSYELVSYNLIMILFGLWYELTNNVLFWSIGTAAYFMILYKLYQNLPEKDLFYKYFVLGWSMYGIISLIPSNQRLIYYNFLDFYNKLVFAMDVRHKIIQDMLSRNS